MKPPADEAMARLLSDDLNEEERSALIRELEADPELLKRMGGHALVEGLLGVALEDEFTKARRSERTIEALRHADQDDFLGGVQAKIHRRNWRHRMLAAAAVLALGISTWLFTRPATVGSVTRLETLSWGEGKALREGSPVKAGTHLQFDKGLVELDMGGRGRMIVEGPADLEFVAALKAKLHRGRMLMRVTEAGHGYRVETPKGAVVDLGTEFGVSVGDDARVETHVLSGEVEAIPGDGKKVLLKKDDALLFDGGSGTRFKTDGGSFYTEMPPQRSGSPAVIHWPLEAAEDHLDRAELRGFQPGSYDMACRAMDGGSMPERVPGKFGSALSFDGKGGYAESSFRGIGGTEPRTVSFWVKVPEDFKPREGFAIVSWGHFEGPNPGAVWQVSINPIERNGPVGHLRVGAHGGQVIGSTDLRDGRWHHVAVVLFQGSHPDIGKHVLLYLDGELEPISRRALHEVDTEIEKADHGVWLGRNVAYSGSEPDFRDGGFFRGAVDEVFIVAGALSQEEIRGLMQRNEMPK